MLQFYCFLSCPISTFRVGIDFRRSEIEELVFRDIYIQNVQNLVDLSLFSEYFAELLRNVLVKKDNIQKEMPHMNENLLKIYK